MRLGLGSLLVAAPSRALTRRTPTDADDVLVWRCDDLAASSKILNSGSAGSAGDLGTKAGSPVLEAPGLFGTCLRLRDSSTDLFRSASPANVATEPPYPITWSGWVKLPSTPSRQVQLVYKRYRPYSDWSGPYGMAIYIAAAAQRPTFALIVGGVQTTLATPVDVALGVWHHFGLTYDGATMRAYVDGDEVASKSQAGALDYGTHGDWGLGVPYSGNYWPYYVNDVRVAKVARSAAWFRSVYERAMMQLGSEGI